MEYSLTNPIYKATSKCEGDLVTIENTENGFLFVVARDSMGTQICVDGKFYPDLRDFGDVKSAIDFLNKDDNLAKAEKFFKESPTPTKELSLFNVMVGIMSKLDEEENHKLN